MATQSVPRLLTFEDYLRTPTITRRFEIIDGVFEFMVPAPAIPHQVSLGKLFTAMDRAASGHGEVFLAPCDVIISRKPLRTRQPDIFFVRKSRLHLVGNRMEAGPDLVVEILSPSNRRKAVVEKLADYASLGVEECWMVDLSSRLLQIWRLNRSGQFEPVAAFRPGQRVKSKVFPAFTLPAKAFPRKAPSAVE